MRTQLYIAIATAAVGTMITRAAAAGTAAHEPTQESTAPEPLPFVEGSWTLAVLPDTQIYAMSYPDLFYAQTRWIADNRDRYNIAYVLHLGDITNNNNKQQWEVAQKAFSILDGRVPYAVVPGNHDYGPDGSASTRDTLLNHYLPAGKFTSWPTFGGVFEAGRTDNSYHLFTAGGTDWIVIALEFGPRDDVVAWADYLLGKYSDRRAIIITHAYLYSDDTRYDWAKYGDKQHWNPHAYPTAKLPGGVNDGQQLWEKALAKHANVTLVINGHVLNDGLGYLASKGAAGNTVHQMLVNYQMKEKGGEAFMRLIEFLPDGRTVHVKAYSPALDAYKTDEANQFTFELDPPLAPWSADPLPRRAEAK